MRLRRFIALCVFFAAAPAVAQNNDSAQQGQSEGPPPQAALGHAILDFASVLYGKLAHERGNIVFAPYDLAVSLYLTAAGAKGETEAEITRVMGWSKDADELREAFDLVNENIKPNGSSPKFRTATHRWSAKGIGPAPDGVPAFRAEPDKVDASNAKLLGNALNAWAKEQTDGRIPSLTGPESPLSDTRLLIARAMRVAAPWARPAKGKNSKAGHQILSKRANMYFGETPDFKVAELELATDHTNLLLILPKDPAAQLATAPDGPALRAIIEALQPTDVTVEVPVFRITSHADLSAGLQALGLASAFKDGDFSGWARALRVADVQQNLDIAVDTEGADMATATYIRLGKAHAKADRLVKPTKRIERPFLFILRDTYWNVPLLFGRVDSL